MRSVIYNYIRELRIKGFTLTEHLPWEDNRAPLYHHNKKHIYVDTAQTKQSPMFDALNGGVGTVDEITTVSVYFVNDAKKLPPDYDSIVELMKGARLAAGTEGYIQKLCQVSSSYIEDAIITHLEFSFRKLLTN
jgi:hypothetical protein